MKTIRRNNEIKRVSDKEAMNMVKFGWEYCAKEVWKEGRKKRKTNEGIENETNNMSDKKKKKLRKENKRKKYQNT